MDFLEVLSEPRLQSSTNLISYFMIENYSEIQIKEVSRGKEKGEFNGVKTVVMSYYIFS